MSSKLPSYRSFLLRLWQENNPPNATWRFSLEDPHTSKRVGFQSLGDLVAFLKEQVQNLTQGEELENDKK